jgi:hypothetical protein
MIFAKIGYDSDNNPFVCASVIPGVNPEPGVMQPYDVPHFRWLKIVNGEIAIVDPANDDLLKARHDAKEKINAIRDLKEVQGFPFMGKIMQSDAERSVPRIIVATLAAQAAIAADVNYVATWTCADNTELTLDASQTIQMSVAFAIYGQGLHAIAKTLKAQIDAAVTIEAVESVAWPA